MADDPEAGEVRFDEDDQVEVYDGQQWRRYRDLPPDDLYTQWREDDLRDTTR